MDCLLHIKYFFVPAFCQSSEFHEQCIIDRRFIQLEYLNNKSKEITKNKWEEKFYTPACKGNAHQVVTNFYQNQCYFSWNWVSQCVVNHSLILPVKASRLVPSPYWKLVTSTMFETWLMQQEIKKAWLQVFLILTVKTKSPLSHKLA